MYNLYVYKIYLWKELCALVAYILALFQVALIMICALHIIKMIICGGDSTPLLRLTALNSEHSFKLSFNCIYNGQFT